MSHHCELDTPISIARHTVQLILRHAMDSKAGLCFGLIGLKPLSDNDSTIRHATPISTSGTGNTALPHIENSDIQHTVQRWHDEGVEVCGCYFTTRLGKIPELKDLKPLDSVLREPLARLSSIPQRNSPIYMPLLLGTAGCLEAFACKIDGDNLCSVPLLLVEDGQQAKNG